MKIYYLDASAWIKRYSLEEGTTFIQSLFNTSVRFACSSLGMVEVIATLARKRKANDISQQNYNQKRLEAEQDWLHFIKIYIDENVVKTAIEVTHSHALRGADAVHLASAVLLKSLLRHASDEIIVVSADEELIRAASSVNFKVLNPINQPIASTKRP